MNKISKHWNIPPRISKAQETELADFHPIIRQILVNRGYTTREAAESFLNAAPLNDSNPFIMKGMSKAVNRIIRAIQSKERIAIYGDYDVDGVTATALLVEMLSISGADVTGYIPNRFDEGYGLNKDALKSLFNQKVSLIITVDCGIRSLDEASYAKDIGIDLIITDHHQPGSSLPEAYSIINPKQPGDLYPEKELAGVGLAYKLAAATADKLNSLNQGPILSADKFLDLVALGTVSDLVPLTGENRYLVTAGLNKLNNTNRSGIQALIGVAEINPHKISSSTIGFGLGPRLNASGRLNSAKISLDLLLTDDMFTAARLAQELETINKERQQITRTIMEQAERIALERIDKPFLLFATDPGFNPGVVGLAASKLTERYYRPAIIGHRDEKFTRASCRSIPEFHITKALENCSHLLEKFGGHAAAAGFTVRNDNLGKLIDCLDNYAYQRLAKLELRPTLRADTEVNLSDLTPDLLIELNKLQPTGQGNQPAFFISRDVFVKKAWPVGKNKNHLKLILSDGKLTFDAIAFGQGEIYLQLPDNVNILFSFEMNEFNGRKTLQLNIKDIKPVWENT